MINLTNPINRYKRPLKLYWWREPHRTNFGDEITASIISAITGRRITWSAPDECELVGAGSVIDIMLEESATNHPYIWGSGFIRDNTTLLDAKKYKIVGVRGRRTLSRVINHDSSSSLCLGDPGLLASLILKKKTVKKFDLGILPHYIDMDDQIVHELSSLGESVRIIDATWKAEVVVEEISKCQAVLSSSLHGLIVSDSLGVPNARLHISDKLKGGNYKFHDYYSIFNDSNRFINYSPSDILGMESKEIVDLIHSSYISPVDLDDIKKNIIQSLPY